MDHNNSLLNVQLIGPHILTLIGAIPFSKFSHLPSNKYCSSLSGLIISSYISTKSGSFTVCDHPIFLLSGHKNRGS